MINLAAQRFGLGPLTGPPTPVAEAWSNDVVRINTDNGDFALKIFPADLPVDRRDALVRAIGFERLVLERGDLPLPRPVTSAEGEWLIEVPSPAGPRLARCHAWVEGTPGSRAPNSPDLIRSAGHYLGALHGMHHPGGDSSALPGVDTERWQRGVTGALDAAFPWAPAMADLTPLVQELASDVEDVRSHRRPLRISHRDFDPKNAVVDHDGQLVITDWDFAGPILAEVEVIVAATSFADTDAGVLQFVEAYEEAGGDAGPADAQLMAVEAGELDWLLRNVEACLARPEHDHTTRPEPPTCPELVEGATSHRTAADLITALARETAELRAWPERLSHLRRARP